MTASLNITSTMQQLSQNSTTHEISKPKELSQEQIISKLFQNGNDLKDMPDEVKENRDFVYIAISTTPSAIQYAADHLKDDFHIACKAVSNDPKTFDNISNRLQRDTFFISRVISRT